MQTVVIAFGHGIKDAVKNLNDELTTMQKVTGAKIKIIKVETQEAAKG